MKNIITMSIKNVTIKNVLCPDKHREAEISKDSSRFVRKLEMRSAVYEVMRAVNEAYYRDLVPEDATARDRKLA